MLEGFSLLLGHLVGDYIFQNDWMAANKTNPLSGPAPEGFKRWWDMRSEGEVVASLEEFEKFEKKLTAEFCGHLACTIHCLLYTLAVWLFSFWWMSWWGLLACLLAHWPVDRFRLARKWMEHVSGQKAFANGPFSPWSIIVVDNIFHLLTLWVIALMHFRGV